MITLCLRSKNNLKTHQLDVKSSLLFRPKSRYFSFYFDLSLGGDEEINDLYWRTEQKARKYTLRIALYVILHTSEFGLSLMIAFISIAVGSYNLTAWPLFFKMVFPFDEYATVLNWFMAWFLETNLSFSYSIVMTAVSSYFVSSAMYIISMCEHFDLLMRSISGRVEKDSTNKNRHQSVQMLTKAVELHVDLIE